MCTVQLDERHSLGKRKANGDKNKHAKTDDGWKTKTKTQRWKYKQHTFNVVWIGASLCSSKCCSPPTNTHTSPPTPAQPIHTLPRSRALGPAAAPWAAPQVGVLRELTCLATTPMTRHCWMAAEKLATELVTAGLGKALLKIFHPRTLLFHNRKESLHRPLVLGIFRTGTCQPIHRNSHWIKARWCSTIVTSCKVPRIEK